MTIRDTDRSSNQPGTAAAAVLANALAGAFMGGVMMGLLVSALLGNFRPVPWWPDSALDYAAIGVVAGALLGARSGWRRIRRRQETEQLAGRLSMKYTTVDSDVSDRLEQLIGGNQFSSLHNVMTKEVAGTKLLVGDLHCRNSGSESSKNSIRTVAYLESPHLDLPKFTLQREGKWLSIFSKIAGVEDIDFETHPAFSRNYHLSGPAPGSVRALFAGQVVDYFDQYNGWEIRADRNRILLSRGRRQLAAGKLERFVQDAQEIFKLLVDSLTRNPEVYADQTAPTPKPAGLLAQLASAATITPPQIAEFLQQPTPRSVPKRISRQRLGSSGCLVFFGACFALFGVLFLGGGLSVMAQNADPTPALGGLLSLAIGATIMYFAWRYRSRNAKLLRYGRIASGVIKSVENTNSTVNGQRRYVAYVRYQPSGRTFSGKTSIYGQHARAAKQFAERREMIEVLYDPDHPERFLLTLELATPTLDVWT